MSVDGRVSAGGEVLVPITVYSGNETAREIEALVDTGFNGGLALPTRHIEKLFGGLMFSRDTVGDVSKVAQASLVVELPGERRRLFAREPRSRRPRSIRQTASEELELSLVGRERMLLASGDLHFARTYRASVELKGKRASVRVVEAGEPLVGMALLWGYDLRIECVENGRVVLYERLGHE